MVTLWPSTKPISPNPLRKAATRFAESSGDLLPRNPITGIDDCCARAASGQIAAEPPSSVMKSRRRIAFAQGWYHANFVWITAGICNQWNGVQGSFCGAAIHETNVSQWVKSVVAGADALPR